MLKGPLEAHAPRADGPGRCGVFADRANGQTLRHGPRSSPSRRTAPASPMSATGSGCRGGAGRGRPEDRTLSLRGVRPSSIAETHRIRRRGLTVPPLVGPAILLEVPGSGAGRPTRCAATRRTASDSPLFWPISPVAIDPRSGRWRRRRTWRAAVPAAQPAVAGSGQPSDRRGASHGRDLGWRGRIRRAWRNW